jgi:hypothetical protein
MRRIGRLALIGAMAGVMQPAQGQEPTTRLEDTGKEFVIEVGPVDLPVHQMAMNMDMEDHAHNGIFPPLGTVTVPRSGYLYGFDYEVVDAQGNLLPSNIVHHFNIIDPDNRELFLPISRRIMAAGSETGGQSMPWMLFGLPVTEGQRMVVTVMLHNPTGVEHLGAALRIRLRYVKTGRPWPFFNVYPYQLDVAFPAGDKSFDLPPGESSRSYEASPAIEGRLMVMGSHLHENATKIVFEDVTESKVIWEGLPIEEDGELAGVTIGRLYRKFGVKIYPDHTYRATVHYNNPTDQPIPEGGMGVVAGVFMPSGDAEWPAADTSDPLYALDRDHYMRMVRGRYDAIKDGGGKVMEMDTDMRSEKDHEHTTATAHRD